MSAVFILPVCLTYWPRKYTCIDPTSIIPPSLRLIWSSTAELKCSVWWYVTWPCDLDFWPFDVEQLSHMAGHVTNPATKFETSKPMHSWVITSFIGYNWHCVSSYCACAVSRDLYIEGKFYLHISNSQPRFAYSLCNFGRSKMKIINVIWENNARPCAKSRDLLKVP